MYDEGTTMSELILIGIVFTILCAIAMNTLGAC